MRCTDRTRNGYVTVIPEEIFAAQNTHTLSCTHPPFTTHRGSVFPSRLEPTRRFIHVERLVRLEFSGLTLLEEHSRLPSLSRPR